MSPLFFEPGEVVGGAVYDSTGLFYGRICGVVFDGSEPRLRVCIDTSVQRLVPDVEGLRRRLSQRGIETAGMGVEELVAAARSLGLDVGFVKATGREELVKALIGLSSVAVMDRAEDGSVIAVLSEPREAFFRGLPAEPSLPPPEPGVVAGKPVVSLGRGYLGRARGIVIGAGGFGVRAVKPLDTYIAWMAFIEGLRKRGYTRLANTLSERLGDPLSTRRLPVSRLPEVRALLGEAGAPEEAYALLRESVRHERSTVVDIEWWDIVSVRDAVIAR